MVRKPLDYIASGLGNEIIELFYIQWFYIQYKIEKFIVALYYLMNNDRKQHGKCCITHDGKVRVGEIEFLIDKIKNKIHGGQ